MEEYSKIKGYSLPKKEPDIRIKELEKSWNDCDNTIMDYNKWHLLQAIKQEITAILKEYPDLAHTIKLKQYNLSDYNTEIYNR